MPVKEQNIKLVQSRVMLDVPEGGGQPSATVIEDGASNAIFDDISELARAGGNVSLRKVHVVVQTDDTSGFYGSNVIIAKPPEDPRVSVTLFTTGQTFDNRTQVQSRVEAYLNKGPLWPGYLYENHIQGQRTVQIFQRPENEVPSVGHTLVLIQDENKTTQKEQYIRAVKVSSVIRTFTESTQSGDVTYKAAIVTIELSDPLRYDFKGSPASRLFKVAPDGSIVRDTVVADAGSYVGVIGLAQQAHIGDYTIQAKGIFTQLVPNAQTESPIPLVKPYPAGSVYVAGTGKITYTTSQNWNTSTNLVLPSGCYPKSLRISTGGTVITDNAGVLYVGAAQVGTIDYDNGILTVNSGNYSDSKTIEYVPAAPSLKHPVSHEIPVTQESRSLSYVGALEPIPVPRSLTVSYKAQGKWYVLREDGGGTISGIDKSFGVGTYNPDTGSYVLTLGALPDVGSSIVLSWGAPTNETKWPVTTLPINQKITISPPNNDAIIPGQLSITWSDGTNNKTATADVYGNLSGDATGTVKYSSNEITFQPNLLPPVGTLLHVNYYHGAKSSDSWWMPSRNSSGQLVVNASKLPILPGSFELTWHTLIDTTVLGLYNTDQLAQMGIEPQRFDPTHYAKDDGNGNIILNGNNIGTINYTTGVVTWNPDVIVKIPQPVYRSVRIPGYNLFRLVLDGINYVNAPSMFPLNDPDYNGYLGTVTANYISQSSNNNQTDDVLFQPGVQLIAGVSAQLIPGAQVLLNGTNLPWGDSGVGVLRERTPSGWVNRGNIDYINGKVELTSWIAGQPSTVTRLSCVSTVGKEISNTFVFRTAASPLRPGSLTLQFATSNGVSTVTANLDGTISGEGIFGSVDYENGLVRVYFGEIVPIAGNENEPWFIPGINWNGYTFKPLAVAVDTLRYTAVAYSYLPLDANILGLDPVRLPSDGRVPMFRNGGFVVVGNTKTYNAGNVTPNQTVNVGRTRLSRVRVIGGDGKTITSGYTTDLDAGTVTFTNTAGYVMPITIEHRVEDMAQVSDVQINGSLTFTRPVTHDYPIQGSYVSSALIAGDLRARVSLIFDQSTWTGVWADNVTGSEATATFNYGVFPITVTNAGAITERWMIQFTNSTAFTVSGEHVGTIATGNTSTDCSPINPVTGVPYFTIPALGWGSGWSAGNVLRFNTIGAQFPVWVARTVQQGPETITDDSFTILVRGDVDKS